MFHSNEYEYKQRIKILERQLSKKQNECQELREEIEKIKKERPLDNVLVQRIFSLKRQLNQEQKAHAKDVKELQERIDVACEINAKLRHHNEESDRRSQEIADKHIDILATLMCLYPFTPDKDLEFEFGLSGPRIRFAAEALGVIKSPEARREAADYLKRQHIDFIERRGGDQGNHSATSKKIEKVAKNGRIIKTYDSIQDAADDNSCCRDSIKKHCYNFNKKRSYNRDGYTFKFKE